MYKSVKIEKYLLLSIQICMVYIKNLKFAPKMTKDKHSLPQLRNFTKIIRLKRKSQKTTQSEVGTLSFKIKQ